MAEIAVLEKEEAFNQKRRNIFDLCKKKFRLRVTEQRGVIRSTNVYAGSRQFNVRRRDAAPDQVAQGLVVVLPDEQPFGRLGRLEGKQRPGVDGLAGPECGSFLRRR